MNTLAKRDKSTSVLFPTFTTLPSWSMFDNIFDDMFKTSLFSNNVGGLSHYSNEDETSYLFEFDMPGIEKEDIDISLDGEYLSIKANKKVGNRERNYSEVIRVSGALPLNDIKAEYKSGVLSVKIPKNNREEKTIKKIAVD